MFARETVAFKKAETDISEYIRKRFTQELEAYAAGSAKTAPCISDYMDEKNEIEAYMVQDAKTLLATDMKVSFHTGL